MPRTVASCEGSNPESFGRVLRLAALRDRAHALWVDRDDAAALSELVCVVAAIRAAEIEETAT